MRRRFFVEDFSDATAVLRGEAADHLGRVLRAEPGQFYELSDGRRIWLAKIERVAIAKRGQSRIEFALIEPVAASEPILRINLLISLVKFDRFEWCLEKATELGANEIVPLAAARTDRPLIAAAAKRHERWQKILLESAQQARRLRPPVLHEIGTPEQAFRKYSAGLKILLSERSDARPLRAALAGTSESALQPGVSSGHDFSRAASHAESERLQPLRDELSSSHTDSLGGRLFSSKTGPGALGAGERERVFAALAIGPEGGWTGEEIEAARASGFAEASLGENILRTETAVLASLSILAFALEPRDATVK
jgi:16S rRNA (uracil1498-N3)-methyltransferase